MDRRLVIAIVAVTAVAIAALALTLPLRGDSTLKVFTDIKGNPVRMADFKGRVVVLEFMATWCKACKAQLDELRKLRASLGSDAVILSVSIDPSYDTPDKLKEYAAAKGVDWLMARDVEGLARRYGVRAVPSILVIDPQGRVRYTHVGLTPASMLASEVEEVKGG